MVTRSGSRAKTTGIKGERKQQEEEVEGEQKRQKVVIRRAKATGVKEKRKQQK
jgi:hypothetical protein